MINHGFKLIEEGLEILNNRKGFTYRNLDPIDGFIVKSLGRIEGLVEENAMNPTLRKIDEISLLFFLGMGMIHCNSNNI